MKLAFLLIATLSASVNSLTVKLLGKNCQKAFLGKRMFFNVPVIKLVDKLYPGVLVNGSWATTFESVHEGKNLDVDVVITTNFSKNYLTTAKYSSKNRECIRLFFKNDLCEQDGTAFHCEGVTHIEVTSPFKVEKKEKVTFYNPFKKISKVLDVAKNSRKVDSDLLHFNLDVKCMNFFKQSSLVLDNQNQSLDFKESYFMFVFIDRVSRKKVLVYTEKEFLPFPSKKCMEKFFVKDLCEKADKPIKFKCGVIREIKLVN